MSIGIDGEELLQGRTKREGKDLFRSSSCVKSKGLNLAEWWMDTTIAIDRSEQ